MLTADLIRPRLVSRGGQVWTRGLSPDQPKYLSMAADLAAIYRAHLGCRRGELEEDLTEYEGDSLEYPVIRGLARVLADGCEFAATPAVEPEQLRARVFALAAGRWPVVARPDLLHRTTCQEILAAVAGELGLSSEVVEEGLYADLAEEQVLRDIGPELTPGELIERYNLELARGLLYWASEMRLVVRDQYKQMFRYIKLFKLMHTIRPAEEGYAITLDGPISPFVKATTRYGIQMARFLPALLLCQSWRMEADIHLQGETLLYRLDDRTPLRSHYKPGGLFDSKLEEDFAAEFEARYGGARGKWRLAREDEVIPLGDTVMIPDFSFTHVDEGRRALLEIVGFWHPEYLRRKVTKLRQAGRRDLIVLVYEGANCARETLQDVPGEVLYFKRKPALKQVLACVERCAV